MISLKITIIPYDEATYRERSNPLNDHGPLLSTPFHPYKKYLGEGSKVILSFQTVGEPKNGKAHGV